MADQATDLLRLRDTAAVWPLLSIWVGGDLLGSQAEVDTAGVVLMVDLPPDELPWLAVHPAADEVSRQLHLGKRPVTWFCRPRRWPAWNPEYRRVARIWAAPTGTVASTLQDLDDGAIADHAIVKPTVRELREQSQIELEVSRRHLHDVLDRYWDRRGWQSEFGTREDQLWRAAQAVRELGDMTAGPAESNAMAELALLRRRRNDNR